MNAPNGLQSDIETLQILTQQESEKQEFAGKRDSNNIKYPVKIKNIHKIKKKNNSISIGVFGYENKGKHTMYVSRRCCEEKYMDLLLIEEERKGHYVCGRTLFFGLVYKLLVQKKY